MKIQKTWVEVNQDTKKIGDETSKPYLHFDGEVYNWSNYDDIFDENGGTSTNFDTMLLCVSNGNELIEYRKKSTLQKTLDKIQNGHTRN